MLAVEGEEVDDPEAAAQLAPVDPGRDHEARTKLVGQRTGGESHRPLVHLQAQGVGVRLGRGDEHRADSLP